MKSPPTIQRGIKLDKPFNQTIWENIADYFFGLFFLYQRFSRQNQALLDQNDGLKLGSMGQKSSESLSSLGAIFLQY